MGENFAQVQVQEDGNRSWEGWENEVGSVAATIEIEKG